MSDVLSAVIERLVSLEAEVARLKAQELNLPAGAASAPAVTLAGDTDTGIYHSAADNLDIAAGGTNRLNISSAGVTVTGNVNPSGFFNFGPFTELTIVSGVITVTGSLHLVDTEGDAATDDLVTINGGTTGSLLILRSADSSRDTTLKDYTGSSGNLFLAGDFTLTSSMDTITLIKFWSNWFELSRSDNTT
jgi:hypothetical protein